MNVRAEDLLKKPRTREYTPDAIMYGSQFNFESRTPTFGPHYINDMLSDQRIQFALMMIKGPILSAARFYIKDEESRENEPSELKKFAIKNISRFWRQSAIKALTAIEWGYSGSEALFNMKNDEICFDTLKNLHPSDVRVVTSEGKKVGMTVKRVPGRRGKVYLGGPKGFWHIHSREVHPWYGLSRLFGAFRPWIEFYSDGGAKDVRRLYYHKYAFSGDQIYYPVGNTPNNQAGLGDVGQKSNKETARSIIEKRKTGGVVAFPRVYDEQNQLAWEIVEGKAGPGPVDILEYHQTLKEEMFEGMGIPNEVAQAAEVGSGYSGRMVPQTAFFAILQEIVNWLMFDFDQQILRPLITLNFGIEDPDYEVIPFGLLKGYGEDEEREKESKTETAQQRNAKIPEKAREDAQFAIVV